MEPFQRFKEDIKKICEAAGEKMVSVRWILVSGLNQLMMHVWREKEIIKVFTVFKNAINELNFISQLGLKNLLMVRINISVFWKRK